MGLQKKAKSGANEAWSVLTTASALMFVLRAAPPAITAILATTVSVQGKGYIWIVVLQVAVGPATGA